MDKPSLLHQLAYLYISFAKVSNNKIPMEEELTIKKKIARWIDLSYKNVGQYEMVMQQSLEWFNNTPEGEREKRLLEIAKQISLNEIIDVDALRQILSEIRDISVADGYFELGEKRLHDKISEIFGLNIQTVEREEEKKAIGFSYGHQSTSDTTKKTTKKKKAGKAKKK